MTLQELKINYSKSDLSIYPGDRKLRYELFSPLFQNLFEQKMVFSSRIMGIVKVETMQITPEQFRVTFIPYKCIKRNNRNDELFFSKPKWTVSAGWDSMLLNGEGISVPYANWSLWMEPRFVSMIEELSLSGDFDRILDHLYV